MERTKHQTFTDSFLAAQKFDQEARGCVFVGVSPKLSQRAPGCIFVGYHETSPEGSSPRFGRQFLAAARFGGTHCIRCQSLAARFVSTYCIRCQSQKFSWGRKRPRVVATDPGADSPNLFLRPKPLLQRDLVISRLWPPRPHFCADRPSSDDEFFFGLFKERINNHVEHSECTGDACWRPDTSRHRPLQQLGGALWTAALGRCGTRSRGSRTKSGPKSGSESQESHSAPKSPPRTWEGQLGRVYAPVADPRRN